MKRYLCAFVVGMAVCVSVVGAETVDLPLTDDAYINANNANLNLGAESDIIVHSYGPKSGLVRFDAASIAGQTISSATLELYLGSLRSNGEISLHAITSSWDEATVTWSNQPPAEAIATAIATLTSGNAGGTVAIDVTSAAQRWADGSLADAGFLILTGDGIKAYFDAREMPGGVPAAMSVETEGGSVPPPDDGKAIVLDLSEPDNCYIGEPGYYILDRNWSVILRDGYAEAACGQFRIASEGVILDLKGFVFYVYYGSPLRIETPAGVTVRNGFLDTDEFVAIENPGAGGTVVLDRVRVGGAVDLRDRRVIVTEGSYRGILDVSLSVGAGSRIERVSFGCLDDACLSIHGETLVRDCSMHNGTHIPTIAVSGDNNIITGNSLDSYIYIGGNSNIIAHNVSTEGTRIEVDGARNVIDGNIGFGIDFESTGNFYGNNRVASPGGFSGTDGNVDWGGNVSY